MKASVFWRFRFPGLSKFCIYLKAPPLHFPRWKVLQTNRFFRHIHSKKASNGAHVQCFSKPARTRNQSNLIGILPPFPDKLCLVNIKEMTSPYFFKVLIAKSRFIFIHIASSFLMSDGIHSRKY